MQKRGLSTIVVTLILILISLISVGVIWVVVRNLIQTGTEGISLGQFSLSAKIMGVSIDNSSNNISLIVKRNAGKGDLIGMNFVFSNGTNTEVITRDISLKELEQMKFYFHLNFSVDEIVTVALIPLIGSGENQILGNVLETYNFKTGTITEPVPINEWVKNSQPVFRGQFAIASDPTIIKVGNEYRMYYTCLIPTTDRAAICLANSTDGLIWNNIDKNENIGGLNIQGLVFRGYDGTWDERVETPYVIYNGTDYLLYYIGYTDAAIAAGGYGAGMKSPLGMAYSEDGINNFVRYTNNPVINPTDNWYDHNGVVSEIILRENGGYVMVYAGYKYAGSPDDGTYIIGANSSDGISWTKTTAPILRPTDWSPLEWTNWGVGEPGFVKGPDGKYYLFVTSIGPSEENRSVGFGVSNNPFGPYTMKSESIIKPGPNGLDISGVLAPEVLFDNNKIRMWYAANNFSVNFPPYGSVHEISVGYAESNWPLDLS